MEQTLQRWLDDPTIAKIVGVLVGVLFVFILVRFSQRAVVRYVKESDTRYRAKKFAAALGYVLAGLLIVTIFSDQLGGLTVALGVAGAGIAFALQEVIASVAGWLAVSFAGFYKTGDRVQLGGIKGDVVDIGILRTTVMELGQWVNGDLYNGRVVRIANSFVFKEPVFNYSGDFPFLWDEIVLPIRYGSDTRLAREIFHKVANEVSGDYTRDARIAWNDMVKKYMIEDASVEPTVTLVANDNWLEFTLRYVVDYKKRRGTKDLLFSRLLEEIAGTKGLVTMASATFEVVGVPALTVRKDQLA